MTSKKAIATTHRREMVEGTGVVVIEMLRSRPVLPRCLRKD